MNESVSLKDISKKRILIDTVRSIDAHWKVVITDKHSLQILAASCKMFEVIDENVTLVENIERVRQPYPNMDAIYILSPSVESIDFFLRDFTGKNWYSCAHLFFISRLSDELFKKISDHQASRWIKTLKELYIDFIPFEAKVYTLDMASTFPIMFGNDSAAKLAKVDNIASMIVSSCATLNDIPTVRYFSSRISDNPPFAVAKAVQQQLDVYSKDCKELGMAHGSMIILDRSFDVVSPLLHEFTYQAMANDLLTIEDGKKYKVKSGGGDGQEITLDDVDPIWMKYRHTHIAECITKITTDFSNFTAENKASIDAMKGKTDGGKVDTAKLKEAMSAAPNFVKMKGLFSIHLGIAQDCMALFEANALNEIADAEQNMSTGLKPDGSEAGDTFVDIVTLLGNDRISSIDKARLLMIYIISKDGISDDDRKKLLEHAKISNDEVNAIINMGLLGVKLSRTEDDRPLKKKPQPKKKDDGTGYDTSRYVPPLKTMIEEICNSSLDIKAYPYVKEGFKDTGPKKAVTSLRSGKATWQKAQGAAEEKQKEMAVGGRIFIFIIGGMTYSEIRTAYEIAKSLKREVVIGSTHIITPKSFIDHLKTLKKPEK